MDRDMSLFMLTVVAVAAWFLLRSLKVFPPVAAFIAFLGWSLGLFVLSNVT